MDLKSWGPATVLIVIVATIVVAIGGVIVIVHPETLSFDQYVNALWKVAGASGLLGIGRGVHHGLAAAAGKPVPLQVAYPASGGTLGNVTVSATTTDLAATTHDLAPAEPGDQELAQELKPLVHLGDVPPDEGDAGATA